MKRLLAYSGAYDLLQTCVGATKARSILAATYIRAKPGDRVLDIGCGTAQIRSHLPEVIYHGYDPQPRYIEGARSRLRGVPGCTLECVAANDLDPRDLPKFEIVLAIGVLHHLSDADAVALAALARQTLTDGGRLISLDPCLCNTRSAVAGFLIRRDRGRYVRRADAYRMLVRSAFGSVRASVRHDLLRVPYTHLVMECQ